MKGYALGKKLSILVIPVILLAPLAARAEAPIRNDNLTLFFMHVRAGDCNVTDPAVGMITMTTSPSALVFNRNLEGPITCGPLLAPPPDSHQLTLGEFTALKGSAKVKCISTGTHSVLHFSGLVPNGVYTVWLLIFNGGPDPTAAGALGTTNPIENSFTATAAGEGQLSVTTPEEDLSAFGHVGPCWLNSPAQLHLVYHSDNQSHGPEPGPTETWVTNARFLFP
jgi:hypothetical protein